MLKLLLTLVVAGAAAQVATLATTVYLHRALTHRALTLRPPLLFAFRVITWLTTGLKPRQWVAVHRKHHAYTDTVDDPHSPAKLGWLRVQLTNAGLYRRAAREPGLVEKYAKDLPADRWDKVLFDRALIGLGIGIALLIWLLGPWFGLLAAVLHTAYYLGIGGAINGLGHHFGRRPYDNSATNLKWLAWFTGGEGLHNNHHAAPTSARFSLHRGEVDLGWFAIRVFRKLGLAKVRLEELKLIAANGVKRKRRVPV
jgi:stearoyl-CoA desaturase (Delta-9 desaturase)